MSLDIRTLNLVIGSGAWFFLCGSDLLHAQGPPCARCLGNSMPAGPNLGILPNSGGSTVASQFAALSSQAIRGWSPGGAILSNPYGSPFAGLYVNPGFNPYAANLYYLTLSARMAQVSSPPVGQSTGSPTAKLPT